MSFDAKANARWIAAAFVAVLAWCLWFWQPERQVLRHQRQLLEAAQERKWTAVGALMDDGFNTPYGHDKTRALQLAAEALRTFFALQIAGTETMALADGEGWKVRTVLRMDGRGMGAAEFVMSAVNDSREPFLFTWRRTGWKPWEWRLVGADHPLMARGTGAGTFW